MLNWPSKILLVVSSSLLYRWCPDTHILDTIQLIYWLKVQFVCLCRFIFCRATHSLFKPTNHKTEFLPTCMPPLPESVDAESMLSQSCVLRVASFFGAASQFSFAEVTTWPDVDPEEAVVTSSSGSANKGVPETARDSDISNSSSSFWCDHGATFVRLCYLLICICGSICNYWCSFMLDLHIKQNCLAFLFPGYLLN